MEALSWAWLPYSQTSALAGREFISKSVSHSYESHFQHHFDLLPNEVIMHCKIISGFFDVIIASVLSHQTVTEDETSISSSVISCLIDPFQLYHSIRYAFTLLYSASIVDRATDIYFHYDIRTPLHKMIFDPK